MTARALLEPAAAPTALISRLDPRTRVLAAALFAGTVVTAHGIAADGAAVAVALALAGLARLPLRQAGRRLLALEGFMLVTVASLPFTVAGTPLLSVGGMAASAEGMERAGSVMLKASAVMLAVQALLATLEMGSLGHALARLGLPTRLVSLLLFTVRYVEVLHQEYGRLRLAMRARAFRPRTGWHTWRSFGWLVGMLLVMSVERAQRIHAAMRLRAFTGHFHMLDDQRAGALDWGFGALHLASLAAIVGLGAW